MIIAHYAHRLPVNHDMSLIRARAKDFAPTWDTAPNLYFKAFLIRENGRYGAIANNYSSLYLWERDEAFRNFLVDGNYKSVTDTFGRDDIQTSFVLDAQRGQGREARFAYKQELDIPVDTDLTAVFASEIRQNREFAAKSGAIVAAVGVDTQTWRFTRILLSENDLDGKSHGTTYEIIHLSQPLLRSLGHGGVR
jgi:Domain of unknown function (DUF4865)